MTRTPRSTFGGIAVQTTITGIALATATQIATARGAVGGSGGSGAGRVGGWGMGGGGLGGTMGFWGLLWMALLVAVPVVLGLAVLRGVGRRRTGRRDDAALAALRRRYARGDLDDEEYESRRRRLVEDRR